MSRLSLVFDYLWFRKAALINYEGFVLSLRKSHHLSLMIAILTDRRRPITVFNGRRKARGGGCFGSEIVLAIQSEESAVITLKLHVRGVKLDGRVNAFAVFMYLLIAAGTSAPVNVVTAANCANAQFYRLSFHVGGR